MKNQHRNVDWLPKTHVDSGERFHSKNIEFVLTVSIRQKFNKKREFLIFEIK